MRAEKPSIEGMRAQCWITLSRCITNIDATLSFGAEWSDAGYCTLRTASRRPLRHSTTTPARRWKYLVWLLFVAAGFVYFYLHDGWRDITEGRFRRKAQATFSYHDTWDVTEVRIHLLQGDPKSAKSASITLTGKDLEEFLGLWFSQYINDGKSGFCHDPAYNFKLYRGSQLVCETSVCWACNNFSVRVWPFQDPRLCGFDARGKAGQALLEYCDRRLPYYRPPPTVRKTKPAKSGTRALPPLQPDEWPF